ncbi:MAG: CHAT domain-containing protein [bacterium]|nr:CHAT domain-containing protein [bacterium]
MELQGARHQRVATSRRWLGARLAPALIAALCAWCAPPAAAQEEVLEYDPVERHQALFVTALAELDALVDKGDGPQPISAGRLHWYYDVALLYRAQVPERWPETPTFAEYLRLLHDRREELGYPLAPYSDSEWQRSVRFERRGAFDDLRAMAETLLDVYPDDEPHRLFWHVLLAFCDSRTGQLEKGLTRLDELEREIDRYLPAHAQHLATRETQFLVDAERILIFIELGLHEEATPLIAKTRERATALGPGQWTDAVLAEMVVALAVDAFARLERTYEEACSDPMYARLTDEQKARLLLRLAMSRGERERRDSDRPRTALPLFEEVLASPLDLRDRLLAEQRAAELMMDAGDSGGASAALERAKSALAQRRRAPDAHPSRYEVDQIVSEARLALLRRAGQQELEAHLAQAHVAFDALLDRWRATEATEAGLAILHMRDRLRVTESIVELILTVHGEEGPERALTEIVRAQQLGSLARELDAPAPTLADIRTTLVPPDGGLLVFLPGAVHSYVFSIDANDLSAFELPPIYRLDPLLRKLIGTIDEALLARRSSGPAADALERTTRDVAADLLPPAVRAVLAGWDEVGIVGIDSLGYVPFEYLPLEGGERLGDRMAVGYLPSLPVGAALAARERVAANASIALLAAPDAPEATATLADELAPLRFGDAERARLGRGTSVPFEVVGRATLGGALAGDWREHIALQLLGHGLPTARPDRPQGLLFFPSGEDDGVLTPALAAQLRVPERVVLTACGAWRGPRRRGDDGRAHLGGSLLLAGARTIVLSQTAVDYQESLAFTGDWYASLTRDATSPARALRDARSKARERASDDLHPVHAYLFHAVGLPSEASPPVEFASPGSAQRTWMTWTVAGLAGAACAASFALRRRRAA